jgi:hypothetical protein
MCLFALAGWVAVPASAHEFWLTPGKYIVWPPDTAVVRAVAGTGFRGEAKPWDPTHSVRFVARTARRVDLAPGTSPGDFVWSRFTPVDRGGAMFAFESGFTPIELPAAPFDAYLKDQGLDAVWAARHPRARAGVAKPGRERYRRCAKLWLIGSDAARATTPIGLPLEIVPLSIPGSGNSLRVRVLWKGQPLSGGLVKAWHAPLTISDESSAEPAPRDSVPVAWKGRSDTHGEVLLPIVQTGEWLLSVEHMDPSADRVAADWESTWASLTFDQVGLKY